MGEDKKPPVSDGGTNRRRWNKKKRYVGKPPTTRPEKFEGGKEEIDGHYYDCTGYGQSDRFVKTTQKIADYIGQEYKVGGVTRAEVITQTKTIISLPGRPTGRFTTATDGTRTVLPIDAIDISDYQSEKKTADYQIQHQAENRQKVFSLVWQQCTESMHAKIKAHREYQSIETKLDGIDLLRVIKLICFDIEDEKYIPQKVHESKAAFYALKQGKDTDQAYQIKFMNTVQVIEQCGASLGEDPMVRTMVCKNLGYNADTRNATEISIITTTVRDYTLGVALILGADPERYSNMVRGLKNASLAGRDEWPKNVTEAYNYLSKWEGEEQNLHTNRHHQETSFVNNEDKERYKKREKDTEPQDWHVKMTCRNCNTKGHIASFCPDAKAANTNVQDGESNEEALAQLIDGSRAAENNTDHYADLFLTEDQEHRSVSFQLKDGINGGRIPKSWVLLDSQSTTDAFSNPGLLKDIHEVRGSLTIHTQAGKAVTKLRGTVPGYGEVWFCPDGIANILSLARVARTRLVTFDSTNGNQFSVTRDDGSKRLFKQSEHGLYYYDMDATKQTA
jgi:hypothetical protein